MLQSIGSQRIGHIVTEQQQVWKKRQTLCRYVKHLNMGRLSWIIKMGLKSHHRYRYHRESGEDDTDTGEEKPE